MIDFNTAIELIRRNGGFKPNRRDTSYYRTYTMEDSRPMQARVSNHGTWLWTWYDKDYDPSYAINTCVVYSENGEDKSDVSVDMEIKDEEGNVVGERKSFEVTQYAHKGSVPLCLLCAGNFVCYIRIFPFKGVRVSKPR